MRQTITNKQEKESGDREVDRPGRDVVGAVHRETLSGSSAATVAAAAGCWSGTSSSSVMESVMIY